MTKFQHKSNGIIGTEKLHTYMLQVTYIFSLLARYKLEKSYQTPLFRNTALFS